MFLLWGIKNKIYCKKERKQKSIYIQIDEINSILFGLFKHAYFRVRNFLDRESNYGKIAKRN